MEIKHKVYESDLWTKIEACIKTFDKAICEKDYHTTSLCLATWDAYQDALKFIFGVEYHFTRTDEYFGICTKNECDWLLKVSRENGMQLYPTKETIALEKYKECQLAAYHPVCPRCGQHRMKRNLAEDNLSRHADVYICEACYANEELLLCMDKTIPLTEWHLLK